MRTHKSWVVLKSTRGNLFLLTTFDDAERAVIGPTPSFALPRLHKALSLVYMPANIHLMGIIIQLQCFVSCPGPHWECPWRCKFGQSGKYHVTKWILDYPWTEKRRGNSMFSNYDIKSHRSRNSGRICKCTVKQALHNQLPLKTRPDGLESSPVHKNPLARS